MTAPDQAPRVVVVGNGMVGSRFADDLLAYVGAAPVEIVVLGDEDYAPYNRVLLSEVVAGKVEITGLDLPEADDPRVRTHRGAPVVAIDRRARCVLTDGPASGAVSYDVLVLATGAAARVPDLPGLEPPTPRTVRRAEPGRPSLPAGVHGLRSLDDAREIVAASANARRAVVLGAGVLGLEVACGLARRGVAVTVLHGGSTLMDRQLASDAGRAVSRTLAGLGVDVRTSATTRRVVVQDGHVRGVEVEIGGEGDLEPIAADLLVLTAGTIPETRLAREAGLRVDRGVVVGDDLASPDDPDVFAIGDCAQPPEGGSGLIAQGWDQSRRLAAVLADRFARGSDGRSSDGGSSDGRPTGGREADERPSGGRGTDAHPSGGRGSDARPSGGRAPDGRAERRDVPRPVLGTDVVRVKAWGLQVVAMGVCGARRAHDPSQRVVRLSDPDGGRYVEAIIEDGALVGATCVGAAEVGADLTTTFTRRTPLPADPAQLLLRPVAPAVVAVTSPTHMPARATVCQCNGVTKGDIVTSWRDGARSVEEVARATRATTGCGGCKDVVCGLVDWLRDDDSRTPRATPPDALPDTPPDAPRGTSPDAEIPPVARDTAGSAGSRATGGISRG